MSSIPVSPSSDERSTSAPRSWSNLTIATLILSALGFLFAFASGIGLPFAIAGLVCGAVAMRRDSTARPWPLVGVAVSALGVVVSVVLVVLLAATWVPRLPGLLFN